MTDQERQALGFNWLTRYDIFAVPQSQYEPRYLVATEDAVAAMAVLCKRLVDRFELIVVDRSTQLAIVSRNTLQQAWDLNPSLVQEVVPRETLRCNGIGDDNAAR